MPQLLCNMIGGWEFKPEMEELGVFFGTPANSSGA